MGTGPSVNLSMTRTSQKLINGKSVTLEPQNQWAPELTVSCRPGTTQCHVEKMSRFPSCPLAFLFSKTARWGQCQEVIPRQQGWETAPHMLHLTHQVRRKRPQTAAWWGTRVSQGVRSSSSRTLGIGVCFRWPPLLFQEGWSAWCWSPINALPLQNALPIRFTVLIRKRKWRCVLAMKTCLNTRLSEVTCIYHCITMGAGPTLAALKCCALSAEQSLQPANQ